MKKLTTPREITKVCRTCSVELTPANWHVYDAKNWSNVCCKCSKEESRLWAKAWRQRNPTASKQRYARYKTRLRAVNPLRSRAISIRNDSRKRALCRGLDFNLSVDFIVDLMVSHPICPYFGWPLTYKQGHKDKTLASLDRIDSSKGYVRDNVQIVSYLANLMKSNATNEELTRFAKGVLAL